MRDKVTFLTRKDFDVELLIENLQNNSGSVELVEDQKILNEIISLLRKKDFVFFHKFGDYFQNSIFKNCILKLTIQKSCKFSVFMQRINYWIIYLIDFANFFEVTRNTVGQH